MFVELRSAEKEYPMPGEIRSVIWFEKLTREDVALVGGKNASLGEMIRALSPEGIRVPPGFATTADAFRDYLAANQLNEAIAETLARLDAGKLALHEAGSAIPLARAIVTRSRAASGRAVASARGRCR